MASRAPVELSIEGQGLAALQRKLKTMEGGKLLQRELNKELRVIGKDLIPDAREAAREDLPKRGGLAAEVAGRPMRVAISASKREPGVKIVVKGTDAVSTNKGRLRHPVYARGGGAQNVWVNQSIPPGWFDNKMKDKRPEARAKLLAAMEHTAEKIARA